MSQLILKLLREIVWRRLRPLLLNKSNDLVEDAESVSDSESVACVIYARPLFREPRRINALLVSWIEMAEKMVDEITIISKAMQKRLVTSGELTEFDPWPPIPRLRSSFRYSSLDFDTIERGKRRIALYSLADLLGEEMGTKLLQSTRFAESNSLALKVNAQTRNAQMWMMKLQGYVAEAGS